MSSVNSLKVNGVKGRSTRDLCFDHVTTIDFNVVKPVGVFELVPGDRINISPELWLRTQAMNVPTFGKMDVITRSFFVPLRLIWDEFMNFYRQEPSKVTAGGVLNYFSSVPHCSMNALSMEFLRRFKVKDSESAFLNYSGAFEEVDGIAKRLSFGAQYQSSSPVSAQFTTRTGASCFSYKFNPIGHRLFDLFNSLGYRFQFFVPDGQSSSTSSGTSDNVYDVSVLPLVGWLKMFTDWYCPAEFKYLFTQHLLDDVTTISSDKIKLIFDELTWACFIYFNDDIFSMCEQAPYRKGNDIGRVGLFMSQFDDAPDSLITNKLPWHKNTIVPDSSVGGKLNTFEGTTPAGNYSFLKGDGQQIFNATSEDGTARGVSSYLTGGSQASLFNKQVSNWTVMAVLRTAQWLQRNNLLSSRATEYLKAKFGVTPSAERMQITEYIGHAGSPVKISDIAGTAQNNLAELGAKGTSYSIDKFGYNAEEFGYLFVTCELRPRIGYGQGVDPLVLRTNLEEFYNEEFDAVGFEPVPTECLASGPNSFMVSGGSETYNIGAPDNRIFGYLPRGWSYKAKHDNLSGDFQLPNYVGRGDIQSFHLMRCVQGKDLSDYIHNSLSFRYSGLCVKECNFSRIFRNSDWLLDHFQLICSFEAYANGIPLAMNESWQVNADHDEREGHLTTIQASL